jgi:hypothetical protein
MCWIQTILVIHNHNMGVDPNDSIIKDVIHDVESRN